MHSLISKINEARQADGEEKRINKEDTNLKLLGEAKNAMDDMADMAITHPISSV